MATTTTAEPTRRDFIYIATGSVAAVGAAAAAWPLIDQMNPSSAVLALASVEIDLAPIAAACREFILKHNGRHLVGRWPTIAAALAEEELG